MSKSVKKNFPVTGMGCASCVARVQKAISEVKGVSSCNVSLASNSAQVEFDPAVTNPEQLSKAVSDAGYGLIVGDEEDAEEEADRLQEDYYKSLKRDMLLAAILALLVMLLGMGFGDMPWNGYLLWLLSTPAVFWCGRRFFIAAWKQAWHGSANMDTLVALSTLISYLFSLFNLLFPQAWTSRGIEPLLYFESSAMIVAFILIGRVLEERAKHSTTASIRELMGLQPKTVNLKPGDMFKVKPGERIPADGEVVGGESFVDESMLTGEPVAVSKTIGSKVYAGTMNQRGTFQMVKDAQGSKAKIQNIVDKVAAVFVPAILAASVMTLIAWLIFDPAEGVSRGLLAMVSVLVIACPCSLGLATPTALIAGIGNGARQGILIKDADSLQVARSIDAIVLDKTGTITKELKGDEIPTATSDFVDEVKETSAGAVAELKEMGLDVYMLSGDNPERAGKVAAKVGIDNVVSGVLPGDKQNFVRKLQAEGRKVGMAGDGINDSPALALADLSIAMGDGTDIAMNAAMVTIVTSDLKKISQLIKLSRRTFKIIKENLFWAFFYNVLAVPIAAGVLYPVNGFMLNPMIAAACMAMSSVCVVLNSLRLRK